MNLLTVVHAAIEIFSLFLVARLYRGMIANSRLGKYDQPSNIVWLFRIGAKGHLYFMQKALVPTEYLEAQDVINYMGHNFEGKYAHKYGIACDEFWQIEDNPSLVQPMILYSYGYRDYFDKEHGYQPDKAKIWICRVRTRDVRLAYVPKTTTVGEVLETFRITLNPSVEKVFYRGAIDTIDTEVWTDLQERVLLIE